MLSQAVLNSFGQLRLLPVVPAVCVSDQVACDASYSFELDVFTDLAIIVDYLRLHLPIPLLTVHVSDRREYQV